MEVFPMKFNDKETGRSFGNHCGTQFIFYPCFSDWEQNIFERNLWERIVWNLWSIFPPKTGPRLKNNKWGGRQFIVEDNWLGQNQIQVNKFGSRLVLITGQPEPVFLSEEELLKENSSSQLTFDLFLLQGEVLREVVLNGGDDRLWTKVVWRSTKRQRRLFWQQNFSGESFFNGNIKMLCWAETLCGFLTICWQAHDHQPERIWGRGIDEPRVRLLLPQSEDLKFKISWTTRTGKQNENICSLAKQSF